MIFKEKNQTSRVRGIWTSLAASGHTPICSRLGVGAESHQMLACWVWFGWVVVARCGVVGGWPPAMWRKTLQAGNDTMPNYLSARSFVVYALLLGTLLGGFRILQGGHFVSHQIWAMWWVVFGLMVLMELRVIKKRWLAGVFNK